MLEITILRVTHATEAEARKLESYLKEIDVCVSENAALTDRPTRLTNIL